MTTTRLPKHIATARRQDETGSFGNHAIVVGTTDSGLHFRCYRGGAHSNLIVGFNDDDGYTRFANDATKQAVKRVAKQLGI